MTAMIIPPATAAEDTQTGTPLPASGDEVVTAVYEYGCEQYKLKLQAVSGHFHSMH